jgi:transposase
LDTPTGRAVLAYAVAFAGRAPSPPSLRARAGGRLTGATALARSRGYESASIRRRGAISRTGLPEHRDALMGIAWGLGKFAPAFQHRLAELNTRQDRHPSQSALARHACRLCWRILHTQESYYDRRYDRAR